MSPGRHRGHATPEGEPEPGPVTAAEVRAVRFLSVKFRQGYDQHEVDALLDQVVDELDNPGETGLTTQDVIDSRFRATNFTPGYDQDEVDAFLDRVVATLRGREHPRRSEPPVAAAATPPPAWGTDPHAVPAWGSAADAAPAWGTPESATELLADEVESVQLPTTPRLRQGYDVTEVDAFLRRVVATLRHRGPGPGPLTWREVADRTFFPTRLASGYEPAAVDALLERVARELRRRDGD